MRKRNLSEFMCIEMLYDYKSRKLDPLRHQAVEEGLASSPKAREELKRLTLGISYCDKLKNVSVSEPLLDLILNHPKPVKKVFSKLKWGNLPQPLRWACEAIVVAVAIALFVTQVPELFKGEPSEPQSMVVKKFDIKPQDAKPQDTKAMNKALVTEKTQSETSTEKIANNVTENPTVKPAKQIVASKEIPLLLRPPTQETAQKPTQAPTTAVAAVVAEKTPAKPVNQLKKGNAYVYRMTMYVDDVDTVTPEIVALISGLGGVKAGEVELGWRRKSGSYFHFSIPQANSPALQEGLKKYARFNIIKSAHPRVMPEGIERYILWVEKKNAAESPQTSSESSTDEDVTNGPGTNGEESAPDTKSSPDSIPIVEPTQPQEPTSTD